MVSYGLDEEHEALRTTVAEFAREVVAPVIGGFYERHEFPYGIVAEMGKLGLFGLPFPEEYGGMGGDMLTLCVALHELARVDSSVAITLEAGVALGAMPIFRFGTGQQRQSWLPGLCRGEKLAAFGLTEPGGGSDIAGGMRTTARLEGSGSGRGEWVIDGSKAFITNAGTSITSVVSVLAATGPGGEDGRREISAIMVPSGTPGFTVAPAYSKVGWCASDTRELAFSSCRVPGANLLGERGRGYAQFLQTLDEGRVAIAALAAGLLRAAWTSACATLRSGRRSVIRWLTTRTSSSRLRPWRRGRTPPGWPGSTRQPGWWPASRSSARRRSPSSSPPRPPWTMRATRRRYSAGTGS